jgi:hypothetical protein
MKKIITSVLLFYISSFTYSQSLIKFSETPFTLSDKLKDEKGFCYTTTQVNLKKDQILMLSAESQHLEFKPFIFIEGPVINGKKTTVDIKHKGYIGYNYEIIATINETGQYTIVIFSTEIGKLGSGILKSGIIPTAIINNKQIFAMPQQNPFADALSANLRLAIFNFMYGVTKIPKSSYEYSSKKGKLDSLVITNVGLPGTLITKSIFDYTGVEAFQVMTKDGKLAYEKGAQYCMGLINFEYIPTDQSERKRPYLETYNFKDTAILLKRYDSLKTVLINNLSKDFSIERETTLPIIRSEQYPPLRKDGFTNPGGKSVVFTNLTNSRILPDGHKFSFLANKQMKIELSLEQMGWYSSESCCLFIRIYSSDGFSIQDFYKK